MNEKIAIVGLGYWGPNLIRNFLKLVEKEDIILCDVDPERVIKNSIQFGIENYETDYNKILENKDIFAVVISTPAKTHFELVKLALLSGKNVLVEKPITTRSCEAEELLNVAKEKNLTLMVDLTYLYNPAVLGIKEIISSQNFGSIRCVDSSRLNLGIFREDVDVVWDLACHDISILNSILYRNPISVRAIGRRYQSDKIDTAYITLGYEDFKDDDFIIANIHVGWTSAVKIRQMLINGHKQTIVWDDLKNEDKLKIYNKNIFNENNKIACKTGEVEIFDVDKTEALYSMAEDFIKDTKSCKKSFVNSVWALNIVKILEYIDESIIKNGQIINVKW